MRPCTSILLLLVGSLPTLLAADFDHPFNATSIWNTRIGSSATYVTAGIGNANDESISVDTEYMVWTSSSDPWRLTYYPGGNSQTWYGGLNVPDWFYPQPWNTTPGPGYATPNNCTTFVIDGWRLVQVQPCLRRSDQNIEGYPQAWDDDYYNLYNGGRKGTHYGSSLSAFGGSLRRVNLNESQIAHTLKINLWGKRYLYRRTPNGDQTGPGYRWPAFNADSGFNSSSSANYYNGTVKDLAMGSLLALPPSTTASSLGIQTELGGKLLWTLVHYGAYVVDNTAQASHALCVENGFDSDVQAKYGQSLTGSSSSSSQIVQDIRKLTKALKVVSNNRSTSVGGGGTPLP
jgi:hypothetical protein